jgi:hypothetical protein
MFLAHSIRLRDPWQCEPTGEGGLRWTRIFHRPTGLEPDDDLWLVIIGLPPDDAKVVVNGHEFAQRDRDEARTRCDHPSLTLPVKGRGGEDSSVEPQKTPDLFRADLTPILADANRIEIELPPAACASAERAEIGLAPKDAFPFDARLAIVGRS